MSVKITTEVKKTIFKQYGGAETNTGSIEAQIAQLTMEVKNLTEHLTANKKDQAGRKALLTKVGRRRKYLAYLQKKDIVKYRELIKELGIRK
jgi:small subunit ribosomal protein S15